MSTPNPASVPTPAPAPALASAPASVPTPPVPVAAPSAPSRPGTTVAATTNLPDTPPTFGADTQNSSHFDSGGSGPAIPGWSIAIIIVVGILLLVLARWIHSRCLVAKAQKKLKDFKRARDPVQGKSMTEKGLEEGEEGEEDGSSKRSSTLGILKSKSSKGTEALPWTLAPPTSNLSPGGGSPRHSRVGALQARPYSQASYSPSPSPSPSPSIPRSSSSRSGTSAQT
ncbi:MAG: hypothetical protein DHS80DRAFT_23147 [Piptocephalis tieghemiana]|nr:MAG: hypothetical protein DHS80DRAFT_23147 [Piptocephalis tieghemiana]